MQPSHGDFGQASYPGQYAFSTQLSTIPSNTPHDMSKQVAAAQPGMYPNSGMPTAQQHHQTMAGPVPNPQPATLVPQGQQMRANPISMQGYYAARGTVPRAIPNMGRSPLTTVVNQTGQQPASQYGHIQMLPPFPPSMQPVIVNHQFQQMYQQRPFSPPQNLVFQAATGQPVYLNNQWGGPYHNTPQPNSNGYYQSLPTYTNPIPPAQQISQQPPAQTQKKTKALAIIDPVTGKSIFDGSNDEDGSRPTPEKETENSDPNICVQFAAQVAATLNEKSEPLSKSSSVEDTRVMDSQNVISLNEIDVEPEDSELGDIESLADVESSSDIDNLEISRNVECVEKHSSPNVSVDLHSINKTAYETEKSISQVAEPKIETQDSSIYNSLKDKETHEDSEEMTAISSISNEADLSASDKSQSLHESPDVVGNEFILAADPVVPKTVHETQVVPPSSTNYEDIKSIESDLAEISSLSSSSNSKLAAEAKRSKSRKKKTEYNRKGESKDGGEMDAFLDKGEDVVAVPVSAVPTAPICQAEEQPLSPLPAAIVDSELLSTIPLPGEILSDNSPQSDVSPIEQSDSSSISPTIENEDKENVDEPAQNKINLKYCYKADQWSPINVEGKKQYDRDFLLQLQCQPMSLVKPQNLPNLDVIKDKAHIQKLNEINRSMQMPVQMPIYRDHFLPQFAQRGVPRMPQMNNYANRRSLQGRDSKTKKVISLSQNVKLHEADNAWKPLSKQETAGDQIDVEKEKLKRSVQGILNKLTPQKFETLLQQVKTLSIDNEEKLCIVIDLIFEKAVDEPNFSVPYANMCKHLALIKVPTENKNFVNFRKVLLTKCQKEFEQDRSDELKHEERLKALEEAAPEKKKELEQEMYDEEKKMRYRQLGNIRFIGELFKLGMLTEPIMHECIKRLLSQGDEESLECLCKLLKTIGKELDDRKIKNSKETMEKYFQEMQKVVEKRLTSSRVRFMLQDVIDLKRNDWVPRRDENNPKTIDQIHKEAEREAREQQQNLQNMSFQKRVPDERDRRKSTARNMGTSEDGWTSSTKSSKVSYSLVDPNKLKLTKPDEVESIRLGPGRTMQSWGRGSSGGTKTPAGSFDPEKTALQNRYSALAEPTSNPSFVENRRGSQGSAASSRESSRGRNTQLPSAIRKTPSTSKERDNVIEAVKGLVRGGTSSETKAAEKKSPEPQLNGKAAELQLHGPEMDMDQMEVKARPLVDEFLHNNDFEEAIRCVTELASPSTIYLFINAAINQVLERSSQARHSLGQLLFTLVKQKIITIDDYKKGFEIVLENVDEYALDIPLIWEYIGEILEPMLEDNKFSLTFLKDVLRPCIPSQTAGLLVSATLHCVAKRRGTIKLGELWRESKLQWTDFLGDSAEVDEFILKHKLEFTICPTKVKPITPMSIEEIKKNLLDLLEKTEENEEIFDWIDANVSECTEPKFIRALVSAVHENAIKDTTSVCELDVTTLKKRIAVLTRYIDHNENLELQALYAIQSLMNQLNQPKGILRQIFDILYDDDVITEESFKNWEQSDDINEVEGKGVALHSVKSFFTWLKESDSGDSVTDE